MRYTREDGCRAWLTHALMRADVMTSLLEEFGSADAIYTRIVKHGGTFLKGKLNEGAINELIEAAAPSRMHEMMLTMNRLEIGIIGQDDSRYPDALRNIPMPPALLFYRGSLDCLMGKCIGVVGSRVASPQGLEITRKICRELSEAGVTIVSGFALGIDTAAHEGCLAGGSPTAAILATGLDIDYPGENVHLKDQILHNGGVLISEYPPGFRANKYVFPVRNRIISGLSKAVVMMESRIQSGSMHTVHHALDQGKEVFAYPGIPGTEWAEGAHQLLREGANYFTSAQDLLEDLSWENQQTPVPIKNQHILPPLNEEQRKVCHMLAQGDMSFDQLVSATGLTPASLSVALTMLQMMGLIKSMPGKTYSRV